MKSWLNIGCMCMLLGLMVACTKEQAFDLQQGKASLTLEVATSAVSRATAPGDGNLYEGGGMEDLTVVLVNSNNVIVAKQQVTGLTGNDMKTTEVTIDGLDVGNYALYVLANTENALLAEAGTLLSNLNVGSTWNAKDELFTTLANTDVPTMNEGNPLLLTACQEVTLGINGNNTTVDLLRPIVWFQVKLHNHSDKEMKVSSLSFSNFNPSTGYLFPHDGNVPESVEYRGLPAYAGDVTVAAGANDVVYETALFENAAPSYTMNMTLQTGTSVMQDVTTLNTNTQYALKNRSTGKYLVDNDGKLGVVSYTGAVPDEALWTFSGVNSGYLTNVGTGKKYYRQIETESSGYNLTFEKSENYFRLYYSANPNTIYLYCKNVNEVGYTYKRNWDTSRDWLLQIKSGDTASLQDSQLMAVNSETGATTPMTQQIRNQHITVTVNAYYHEQEGTFSFEVEPWQEKETGIEFN